MLSAAISLGPLSIKMSHVIWKYCIQPYYRTYPYKLTVKQFRSLQVTARVFVSTFL